MTTPTAHSTSVKVALIAALLTSALGAAILFSTLPGINWPLWVIVASASVALSRISSKNRIEPPLLILLVWASLLSIGLAVTDNPAIHFLVVLGDMMLLGLSVIVAGVESWSTLSAKLLVTVPFLAPIRVWRATAHEIAQAPGSISSPRARSILRGILFSTPLVVILSLLLRDADPLFHWGTERISDLLPDWSFPARLLFFVILASITLGANSIAARQSQSLPVLRRLGPITIGFTEQRMMLWSAAILLWIFVLLQLGYSIHPPPAAIGSGITFAEYARRGFGELSVAATLVTAIILALEYGRPRELGGADRKKLRMLELALVVALELVLLSAFRRVIVYEAAYGFTSARLFAQVYMMVMAASLAALAVEITNGSISLSFGRRVAELALAGFTILVLWNYEGWIVDRNIERAAQIGKFDSAYALSLSRDAIPTLLRRRADIPPAERAALEARLACVGKEDRRWFEWNRSAVASEAALASAKLPPCAVVPKGSPTQLQTE